MASWLQPLSELKVLEISCGRKCSLPPTDPLCWLIEHRLAEILIHVDFPSSTVYEIYSPTDVLVDSVLKSAVRGNIITKMVLPNISRETMAGVRSILLHCPSLTTLELKKTRLGYDGILYICSALRTNKTLTHLAIYDDLQLPYGRNRNLASFKSMETVPLPGKTTCTDFLLDLNDILNYNTTLEDMKIRSGLFLPPAVSEYRQWTGLGPLQQFNVGAVRSGMSPNLRRSFSSSDLTQPQTQLFWYQKYISHTQSNEVDFKRLFLKKKAMGKKLFSLPSFTAPDTAVLQSFSGLDPRLKEFLEISNLRQYAVTLRYTYQGIMRI